MSEAANIRSAEAIERLRLALLEFATACQEGLDEMEQVVRRVTDWLEHDRPAYWKEAIRQRQRYLHDARQQLARCLMFAMNDENPSCREERGAVRQAEATLVHAEGKAERVRHYRQLLRQEGFELQGRIGHLASLLNDDVPRAVAALGRILEQVESYRSVRSPGSDTLPTSPPRAVLEQVPRPHEGKCAGDSGGRESRGAAGDRSASETDPAPGPPGGEGPQ